jgi:hypothetical protein
VIAGCAISICLPAVAAPKTYDIQANDGPVYVGDQPYDAKRRPDIATMEVPVELTNVAPYAHPKVRAAQWVVKDTPLLFIKNDQVEVGLAPDIGGSILIYRLNSTGDNYFKFVKENLNLRSTVWVDWGGFCDLGYKSFWGEPFYLQRYDCTVEKSTAAQSIIGTVTCGNVNLVRRCTIRPGSTSLTIHVKQTNVGQYPKTLRIFNHPTVEVGKTTDETDLFFGLKADGSLFRYPYIIGEETWHSVSPKAGWAAITDPIERKAWIRVCDPQTTAALGFWPSQNMGHWYLDQLIEHVELPNFTYYNAEALSHTKYAAPGESLAFEETYFVVDGLPEVHFVADMIAGYLLPPAELHASSDTLAIEVGVGSDAARQGVSGELAIVDAQGKTVSALPVSFGNLKPGTAVCRSERLSLSTCADGVYSLEFRLTANGKTGVSRHPVRVDHMRVRAVVTQQANLRKQYETLAAATRSMKERGKDVLAQESDLRIAAHRLRQGDQAVAEQQYVQAEEHYREAVRRLERCVVP